MCLPHSLNSTGEPRSANWHSARKAPYTRVPAGRPSHACGVEPIHAADTGPHAARRAPYTRLRSRASATDHPIVRFLPVARSRCAADPRSTESTVHPRGSAAPRLTGPSAGSRAARRAPYTHPRSRVANTAPDVSSRGRGVARHGERRTAARHPHPREHAGAGPRPRAARRAPYTRLRS